MRPAPKYLRGGTSLPRPLLWGMVGLSLTAGVLGFLLGRDAVELSETDAITAYAARYVDETGGAPTDCAATPGTGAVWLVVRCGTGEDRRIYPIARDGRLARRGDPPEA